MGNRSDSFLHFNFLVALGTVGSASGVLGGFSVADGLADRRWFGEAGGQFGVYSQGHISLKRGVVHSQQLQDWLGTIRTGGAQRRDVTITLRDEAHNPVTIWRLTTVTPISYNGPVLSEQETNVAIEELVLSAETVEVVS